MNESKINKLVGKPISVDLKNPKAIGSPGLILKSFVNHSDTNESMKIDSKCNIERRPNGLILYSNYSNKRTAVPVPNDELKTIRIVRGKERIAPFPLSPMWILLKLGVSILKARYFRVYRLNEYSIEEMTLELTTSKYEFQFIANGYLFERQMQFLKTLNAKEKLSFEFNKDHL